MSAELRFRIWNHQTSQFLINTVYGKDVVAFSVWDWAAEMSDCLSYPTTSYIFQQYTGCWDKDNKQIYDGDILEYNHGNGTRIGYIGFAAGIFFLNYSDETDDELGYLLISNLKIIGNIFENPELLKQ